jgi:type IX secretion system PorP/SprF family membrane protein
MKSNRKTLLLIFFVSLLNISFGQDINFSQFYDIPMLRNPSLGGIFNGNVRVTSAYRNQWQSVTVPYRTVAFGLELKRSMGENSNDYITYGIQLTNDMAGDSRLSRTQVFPMFNYHKSLNEEKATFISAGFMGGPVMQQFDPSKLSFDDQFVHGSYSASNPTAQTFSTTKRTYWDPAVGLTYSSTAGENTNFYIGTGIFHLTKPKVAFMEQNNNITLLPKYVLNAGLTKPMSDDNRLILYGDFFMQGGSKQMQGGFMVSHDLVKRDEDDKVSITGGIFYRHKDAMMPVVKLEYYKTTIGMSYDMNTSKLKTASEYRGGYEVTVSYKAFRTKYTSPKDMMRCPRFF